MTEASAAVTDSHTLNEIWQSTCSVYTKALEQEYESALEQLQVIQNHVLVALKAKYESGEPLPAETEILTLFRTPGATPVK